MSRLDNSTWLSCAEAYAFFGNSLLSPMTQTSPIGLDPDFWGGFFAPNDECRHAVGDCEAYACAAVQGAAARDAGDAGDDVFASAVQATAVEYARLFVGPPEPAAPPWETMHGSSATVGFGAPTFSMRRRLREAGLEVGGPSNQYEDHLGIELLYLSELCRRRAAGEADVEDELAGDEAVSAYLAAHPLGWIDSLLTCVEGSVPSGYYAALLRGARALLAWHRGALS